MGGGLSIPKGKCILEVVGKYLYHPIGILETYSIISIFHNTENVHGKSMFIID